MQYKIIDEALLNATTDLAKASPRLRMNHNFHEDLNDPINRLLNAMEPDSYIRPHRHLTPPKTEIFLLLRGRVALFLFDDQSDITKKLILSPNDGVYGAEIEAGIWHALLVLESGSVVYEVKKGPFAPVAPDDFAPFSPSADDKEAVKEWLEKMKKEL